MRNGFAELLFTVDVTVRFLYLCITYNMFIHRLALELDRHISESILFSPQ